MLVRLIYNSIVFVVLLGLAVIFHYLYDWTDLRIISYFVPINESIWEHLKLAFYPGIFVLIIELFIVNNKKRLFISSMIALVLEMVFIIISYYTITGIIGRNIDAINIILMIIGIILYLYFRLFFYKIGLSDNLFLGFMIFIVLNMMFIIFTIKIPNIGIFISQ